MIPGLNTEVMRKGCRVHVQTEDHGLKKHLLVSQVFIEGAVHGTKKADYSDLLGQTNTSPVLRRRLRQLHLAQVSAVQNGGFDQILLGERQSEHDEKSVFPETGDCPQ